MEATQAAVRIGHIAEVVAAIVKELDTLDLVKAQRVSKTWAYEIRRSRTCQEKLFTLPGAPQQFVSRLLTKEESRNHYYILRDWKEAFTPSDMAIYKDSIVAAVHPLLEHADAYRCNNLNVDFDFERLLSLPAGKWQDMFITQPPPSVAELEIEYRFDEGPFLRKPGKVYNSRLVKAGRGVQFKHILAQLKGMVHGEEVDMWDELPYMYERMRQSNLMKLDDYLASYGFPRASITRIEVSGYVHATDPAVTTAVRDLSQIKWKDGDKPAVGHNAS